MSDMLLRTKLFAPPARPNLVSRPRLFERLNQGLQPGHRLTLISAPAGFGKTTLLSAWVTAIERPAAWLSLDEADNDPARFLAHVVAALQTVAARQALAGNLGKGALAVLQSPQPPPAEAILTAVLNEIIALPGDFVLALDDYHLIDSGEIDTALAFLLEHMPPRMHLIIATREDPDLPLARLRARGQLVELRAAALRFTSAEAADFLKRVMGLRLSAADIVALETRTEGWIAGLQLAAISMQGQADTAVRIHAFTGSHRFVLDYLIEEVLEQQPADVQTFLLQTAVLDRLSGSLCEAVTDQDNGREVLEALEHANLFIIPLDEERHWYRYHQLFADLLRQQLRQQHPEWEPVLHDRASAWYEQHGYADEAIEHALRREDFERAAALIAQHVDDIWQQPRRAKLRRWLNTLPADVLLARPHLCILQAGNLYTNGHVDEADRCLQVAEQALNPGVEPSASAAVDSPNLRQLRGRAAALRSYLASFQEDVDGSIRWARRALDYLPQSDATWRWSAFDSIGTTYSGFDDPAAYQARSEALKASRATGNAYIILLASLRLVVTLRDLGRLPEAIVTCRQQLELADENGLSHTALVGWLFALWGEMLAERNELDGALRLARKGVELTERGHDAILRGSSYLCLMRVLFSRGDMAAAERFIEDVQELALRQELSPWTATQMAAWQARVALVQGRLEAASDWIDACERRNAEEPARLHDFDNVVLARILIAQGQPDAAAGLLQRLLAAAQAGGRISKIIEIQLLQALALQAQDKTDQAVETLEQTLIRAEPGGFVRIFADEGQPLLELLARVNTAGMGRRMQIYVDTLCTAAGAPDVASTVELPAQSLVEPLSEREIEVLQLISEGLTNREIAARLYLSLNTVKVHTRNINGKLDAHNRTQAVARARDLGILSDS